MYVLEIDKKAEADIDKAAAWYDKRVPGVSFKFYDDIDDCLRVILKYPKAFGYYNVKKQIRKCRLNTFKFHIFYHVYDNIVHVFAVLHERRSKKYIKRRLR